MDIKTCKKCNEQKSIDLFGTFISRKGIARHRGTCLDCRALYHQKNADRLVEYRRAYNAERRSAKKTNDLRLRRAAKDYVDNAKTSAPCMDCRKFFPAVCMDFDHRPGTPKVRNVSALVASGYKLDLIIAEIAKCDLVCACCHRIRTAERKENLAPNQG